VTIHVVRCWWAASVLAILAGESTAQVKWVAQAPGPNTRGQVESVEDGEVAGAINAIAPHPTNSDVVYVGAVNGGVWRTNNAMAPKPSWLPLTDGQRSHSIGAIEIDPTDSTANTVVAGTGRFSSLRRQGGERIGILRTTDGGKTWTVMDGGGGLVGLNVAAIAARGSTIVIGANDADNPSTAGIWRTVDGGTTWVQVSGGSGTGLPSGPSSDIAGDPSDPKRLFAVVGGSGSGVFRSTDTGATWTKVSSAAMNTMMASASNGKVAVGTKGNVYAAIVVFGELGGVFRSGNAGQSWTAMDLPTTSEGGAHIGRQGGIHLSIAADPKNPQLVYIGGDRQPAQFIGGQESNFFPNSIGAQDYSGRLFRGDASKPSGSQWVHLTHSKTLGASGGGTANGSAPHADSRDLAFAANGTLLEVDDGGVYRRTSPQSNAGDWFSMNGDLQATEFHSVTWDANADLVIGGAQDTGTPQQLLRFDVRWQSVSTGDGGVVAVDDISTAGFSTRYSSYQFMSDFRREIYDAKNVRQARISPMLTVIGGGNALDPMFYSPIRLNTVTPTRMIVGGQNGLYESFDEGDTVSEIASIVVNDTGPQIIAYGAAGNTDMLYVGSESRVFVRSAAPPQGLVRSDSYPGGRVLGIAIDPANGSRAFVIDQRRVFRTADAGSTWTEITGNLQQLAPATLRSITFSTAKPASAVVVGSDRGVFQAEGPSFSSWQGLGAGFPGAPVYQLEYDTADRILLAGTLGRGAWTLEMGETTPPSPIPAAAAGPPPPGAAAPPQPAAVNSSFELRPGVVIDRQRGFAYVMTPEGGTEAVSLANGSRVWNSSAAAKPLAVARDRLVGQAETNSNTLRIVVLDPATGKELLAGDRPLPAGVRASVSETNDGVFVAAARPTDADPVVSWEYRERHKRGVPPGTEGAITVTTPGSPIAAAAQPTRAGAFRFNVESGASAPADAPGPSPASVPRVEEVPPPQRVAGESGQQLFSADRRHVMTSAVNQDGGIWSKYRWTIVDAATAKPIGTFTSHLARAPFFVNGSEIVYETGPYVRGETTEPLKIRAADLQTGKELWSRVVRDTAQRSPRPGAGIP
jgi:photosystem II stability/assembly factor-like uncharacterized protein